jgi:hypothetical protein
VLIIQEVFFNFVRETPHEEYDDPEIWFYATKYYLKIWDRYKNKLWFISWNWAAYSFSSVWLFAYRKMYLYAFLYLIFSILLSLLLVRTLKYSFPELSNDSLSGILGKILFGKLSLFSSPIAVFSLVLSFCLNLVPPIFANSLYLSHAKNVS